MYTNRTDLCNCAFESNASVTNALKELMYISQQIHTKFFQSSQLFQIQALKLAFKIVVALVSWSHLLVVSSHDQRKYLRICIISTSMCLQFCLWSGHICFTILLSPSSGFWKLQNLICGHVLYVYCRNPSSQTKSLIFIFPKLKIYLHFRLKNIYKVFL